VGGQSKQTRRGVKRDPIIRDAMSSSVSVPIQKRLADRPYAVGRQVLPQRVAF
jgi:hypothetical protein